MAFKVGDLGRPKRNGRTYTDLHFDFSPGESDGGRADVPVVPGRDFIIDADLAAIRNSVVNILTTQPGQRPLNIGFGTNLLGFMGAPVDDVTGGLITREIRRSIELWEPRVEVLRTFFNAFPDQYRYEIAVVLNIPSINEQFILSGDLQSHGFTVRRG